MVVAPFSPHLGPCWMLSTPCDGIYCLITTKKKTVLRHQQLNQGCTLYCLELAAILELRKTSSTIGDKKRKEKALPTDAGSKKTLVFICSEMRFFQSVYNYVISEIAQMRLLVLRQVFVFVTTEYENSKNALNQVSLWDHVIPDKDHANVQVEVKSKYPLTGQGSSLRGKKVQLVLHWHVMPNAGRMMRGKMPLSEFSLPDTYTS